MKKIIAILFGLAILFTLTQCHSGSGSKNPNANTYEIADVKLNDILEKKVGSWIKEGSECYGVIMITNPDGSVNTVKEVKAVVLIIQNDKIKMKALEEVSLAPKAGCKKLSIDKGETWWETEGDLFLTREEAIAFAKTVKLEKRPTSSTKFTID